MRFYFRKMVRNFRTVLRKKLRAELNNKGFSLISTLVVSVTGLLVIFGLNKSLNHVNTQLMQSQHQMKQHILYKKVKKFFEDDLRCSRHFSLKHANQVANTAPFTFRELFETGIDLADASFLRSSGLEPPNLSKHYNNFEVVCDSSTPKDCNVKLYFQDGNEIKVSYFSFTIQENPHPPPPALNLTPDDPSYYKYECNGQGVLVPPPPPTPPPTPPQTPPPLPPQTPPPQTPPPLPPQKTPPIPLCDYWKDISNPTGPIYSWKTGDVFKSTSICL